ncbi:site-specific integrase [Salegentibacter sp. JZCK2]|uniref:site-specific integrase n=1 Tax=Salegentibacter tibetensis TaxID=2873600 RepID=UPI001CCF0222|nr:site-specific integrase [Salegentibacter tibetensis]MBZ9728764.1 site-specific integrase [Salegentibacter tibetensis]
MSSNASITLRKKPNKKEQYPLAIRITKFRKSSYLYIGHYISLNYWDDEKCIVKKSHPNAARLNYLLLTKLAETNRFLLQLQAEGKDFSAAQIKKDILFLNSDKNFFDIADAHLEEIKANNKFGRLTVDKAYIGHIATFVKSRQLSFQDLDETFLRKYMNFLKNSKKLSERTIVNHLVLIRLLFNRAIKQGLVDRKLYPFGKDKVKIKFPETRKIGLTVQEIQSIEKLNELTDEEYHARNIWLFSFYLAGIRVSDVLRIRWSDIYDNRLHYTMNKNSKLVSLQLPEKIHAILKDYINDKGSDNDFIFPELKVVDPSNEKQLYAKAKNANKWLNSRLTEVAIKAGITKKLTMHIARHSFGNIAGDKIPVQMLQQLYRHSSVTTTMMYQSYFISQETDKALNSVVDF